MPHFRIALDGVTLKEAQGLIDRLQAIDEVESAGIRTRTLDHAFDPSNMRPMASVAKVEIVVHLAGKALQFTGVGITIAAGKHLYSRIGEKLVDELWSYMTEKFSGKSAVPVESTLYGPDNKPIKKISGKR